MVIFYGLEFNDTHILKELIAVSTLILSQNRIKFCFINILTLFAYTEFPNLLQFIKLIAIVYTKFIATYYFFNVEISLIFTIYL